MINSVGNTPNNYLYAGEQFDHDLNLYYNRARYLDVNKGRFINQDSFEGRKTEPKSLHKYLYVNSNPVNNVDPSGHLTLTEAAIVTGIGAVLGGISGYYLLGVQGIVPGALIGGGSALAAAAVISGATASLVYIGFTQIEATYLVNTAAYIYGAHQSVSNYIYSVSQKEKNLAIVGFALSLVGFQISTLNFLSNSNSGLITTIFNNRPAFDLKILAETYGKTVHSTYGNSVPSASVGLSRKTGMIYYDINNGQPLPPNQIHPSIPTIPSQVPPTGSYPTGRPPSVCPDFKVVNRALFNGENLEDIDLYTLRPRTGTALPRCPNCQQTTSGVNAVSDCD